MFSGGVIDFYIPKAHFPFPFPFALSLSKHELLSPFDKLRANG